MTQKNWHSHRTFARWFCHLFNGPGHRSVLIVSLYRFKVFTMICNRFKVWQDSFSLIVAASLIGCGSSNTSAPTTSVPGQTTAVAAAPPSKPGMPTSNAPGGAGHMNAAHMQMMSNGGQVTPPGMSAPSGSSSSSSSNPQYSAHMSANMQAPNSSNNGGSSSSAPPGMAPPGMAAHMSSPTNPSAGGAGSNSNSPSNMDASKMMAHSNAGGSSSPNGAAMPPGAMAAHSGGQSSAPGMSAPGGANAQNSAAAAQMRGANGQSGAMPGQPGGAGSPAGNLTPGSVEDTLYKFCVAIADGDTAAAAEYVSPKAKGLIGQIRDGELSEEKLEEITDAISPVTELQPNPSQTNTKRSLRNRKNQVISFTLKKDKDEEYKITEFSISKPKKGAQAGQGGQGGRGGQGGQGGSF